MSNMKMMGMSPVPPMQQQQQQPQMVRGMAIPPPQQQQQQRSAIPPMHGTNLRSSQGYGGNEMQMMNRSRPNTFDTHGVDVPLGNVSYAAASQKPIQQPEMPISYGKR
jgi:hypothetical protein